jgi:hypothetical protein
MKWDIGGAMKKVSWKELLWGAATAAATIATCMFAFGYKHVGRDLQDRDDEDLQFATFV